MQEVKIAGRDASTSTGSDTCTEVQLLNNYSVPLKYCNGCCRNLRIDSFGQNLKAPDGHEWRCKECRRAKARAWRKANPERVREHKQREYIKNREKYLARSRIQRKTKPEAAAKYLREWNLRQMAENPDGYKEAVRVRTRRRRARLRNAEGDHTLEEFLTLCERYERRCLRCYCKPEVMTADHIIPLSKGGSNDIDNIQPLCGSCNKKKNARTADYRQTASERILMAKITPKADVILEDGWYPASIGEVEERETKYGERLMVPFDVDPGDDTVVDITAFISFSDHPKSNVVKWGKALFGDRAFDTDEFTDVTCEVFVEEGEDADGQPKNFIRKLRPRKGAAANGKAKGKGGDEVDEEELDFDSIPF